ncbi:Tubulin beta chain [Trichinella pseudospiralis]
MASTFSISTFAAQRCWISIIKSFTRLFVRSNFFASSSNFLVVSPFILSNRILSNYLFKIFQLFVLEQSVWFPARGTKIVKRNSVSSTNLSSGSSNRQVSERQF